MKNTRSNWIWLHPIKCILPILILLLSSIAYSQTVIGTYPSLDGGFEGQATGNLAAGSGGVQVLTTSTWTVNTTATIFRGVTATGGRSGPKYLTFGANGSGTAKNLFSPQIAGAFAPTTQYQIQFFYKTTATVALQASTADLYVDNSSTTSAGTIQSISAGLGTSIASWTKVSLSLTTAASPAAGTNGVAGFTIDAVASGTYGADLDDFVIYQGAADNTAPSSPSSVSGTGNVGSIDVSWSAPGGGVDGGGYVVVRYATTSPAASDDPNQNGIYAVGNSVTGSATGTVRYIGTGTSFNDNVGISPLIDYYYKVYAVDKAFNYSAESQSAAVQSLATTYYYKGTGSLANVANWGTNTDGTGTAPANFTDNAQVFEIRNTTAVSTDAVWTVSGTGSSMILGNASQPGITLTVASGFNIANSGLTNFNVAAASSGNQKVIYQDANPISLGTILDPNFVLEVDGVTLTTSTTKTYGTINVINGANATFTGGFTSTNFNVSSSSTSTISNTTPVITNLTIDNTSTLILTNQSGCYITIPSTGTVTINGSLQTAKAAGFVSSNVVTAGTSFGSIQFLSTENLTLGSSSNIIYNRSTSAILAQTVTPRTDYKNLTISTTGLLTTVTLTGNLTVAGTLTLNSDLAINGNTLTLNGAISGSSEIVGSTTSNLTITGSSGTINFDQTTPGTTNVLRNLTISGSGTTTLGSTLNITGGASFGIVTVGSGATLASAGNLILKSDAAGTASIANLAGSITGNITAERFVSSAGRRWRFLSSPVAGNTISNWRSQFAITGPGATTSSNIGDLNANGWHQTYNNITNSVAAATTSVRSYTEANSTTGNLNLGWSDVTTSQSLTAGQGFRTFIRGPVSEVTDQLGANGNTNPQNAVTLSLSGTVNSGDIAAPSLTNAQTGWNLLGNPYPCAYDFNAHYDANIGSEIANIDANVYIFDATSNSYKSYNAISNTASGLTGGIIPSGAGFFIQATGAPTFVFKETYKTTSSPVLLHKTDATNAEFGIKYYKDASESDYLVIKMFDGATLNNEKFDTKKLTNENLNISAYGQDDIQLAASCIPFVTEETRVKLNIEAKETGTYKFDFTNLENFDAAKSIQLFDRYNNTTTDVKLNPSYTFQMGADSNQWGKNRFEIILNGKATIGVNEKTNNLSISEVLVYPNPANDVLNIDLNNDNFKNSKITIYNISGAEVLKTSMSEQTKQINIQSLNHGVYFIRIDNGNGLRITEKFIK